MTATIENELQQLAADLPALKDREETAAQALQRARAHLEDLTDRRQSGDVSGSLTRALLGLQDAERMHAAAADALAGNHRRRAVLLRTQRRQLVSVGN